MYKIIQLKQKRTDDEAERLEVYLRLQKLKEHAERKRAIAAAYESRQSQLLVLTIVNRKDTK